jgi:hypothetical protein
MGCFKGILPSSVETPARGIDTSAVGLYRAAAGVEIGYSVSACARGSVSASNCRSVGVF